MTKLYELPRNSFFQLADDTVRVPPDGEPVTPLPMCEVIKFGHIDGMYSYCTRKSGEVVHFAAWTEVVQVEPSKGW